MRLRISEYDFSRISHFGKRVFVIEQKEHWWSRWKIRDWSEDGVPRFYSNYGEAKKCL